MTSRAACNLLSMVLQSDLLDYSIAMDTARSLLASANGPSAISDSSLRLWASIARMKTQLDPGSAQQASIQICGWLREVWAGTTPQIAHFMISSSDKFRRFGNRSNPDSSSSCVCPSVGLAGPFFVVH